MIIMGLKALIPNRRLSLRNDERITQWQRNSIYRTFF